MPHINTQWLDGKALDIQYPVGTAKHLECLVGILGQGILYRGWEQLSSGRQYAITVAIQGDALKSNANFQQTMAELTYLFDMHLPYTNEYIIRVSNLPDGFFYNKH